MARTGFLYHADFLLHDTGPHHPERPDRLRAVLAGLAERKLLARLTTVPFIPADDDTLALNHSAAYIRRVEQTCRGGAPFIDTPDSAICPASVDSARLAAGALIAACDAVMAGAVDNAFCAVRPPGHHAAWNRSAGFCLFNNIAIAARHLRRRHGLDRVMILDWDVHHGDGTQAAFEDDPSVLFCSLHEDPRFCYPGTGFVQETGSGPGRGYTVNLPMPPGADDALYRQAFAERVLPRAREFRPQVLLISNGLDAHADDPLAGVSLTDAAFKWMMEQAISLAGACCDGRLIVTLEGGYDLTVLSRCVPEQILSMLGD